MSADRQWAGPLGGAHPAVLSQRLRALTLAGVVGAIVLALALEIATSVSKPNLLLTVAMVAGGAGLLTLIVSSRLEITVLMLGIFLGCMDGPIKGFSNGGNAVSVLRDVLILAVCVGALVRLAARREAIRLPPLSGWIAAYVAIVLMQALNPETGSMLKVAGGFRQQLEWIPFFFFGYALIQSRDRLRKLFVVLALIALANGVVATYQTRLSPKELASWGPGYASRIEGTDGASGTTYSYEGEGHVRPLALGSDVGFGGTVGLIALPGTIALLATSRGRRRWLWLLLMIGPLLAVASSLSRTEVLGAIFGLGVFGALSLSAGRQVLRPLLAIGAVLIVAVGLVTVLSSTEGSSAFSRYASISPEKVSSTAPSYKEVSLKQIPKDIAQDPFGFGLGTAGAASGFGGHTTVTLEGHGFSSETEYNFIVNELGLPGLLVFVGFAGTLVFLSVTRLPRIEDIDTRICLAAVAAVVIALLFSGFAGSFTAGQAGGPYYFLAAGIIAYWFGGGARLAPRGLAALARGGAA